MLIAWNELAKGILVYPESEGVRNVVIALSQRSLWRGLAVVLHLDSLFIFFDFYFQIRV